MASPAPGKPGEVNLGMYRYGDGGGSGGGGGGGQISYSQGYTLGGQQATSQARAGTYIPDYLESPILRQIAQYSAQMAPQVYQWGMEQFGKNQGNIDAMMRNALSYASPQRIAAEMGKAQAGVMQGAEAGRQNAVRELQSFGIDPSSGRYAALDQANRVMAGAQAAAAGNQQREATVAQGGQMANQAIGQSLQNVNTGYGAANAANQFLGTGMQLKFPPLGQTSTTDSQSTGFNQAANVSASLPTTYANNAWSAPGMTFPSSGYIQGNFPSGASASTGAMNRGTFMQAGGPVDDEATTGGFVSDELSPSNGARVDDVDARLNAGEFVIPKDTSAWLGQKFFYELMAKSRKERAMLGAGNEPESTGYGAS